MNDLSPINFTGLPALSPEQVKLAETIITQQVERERVQSNHLLNETREREFNRTERQENTFIFLGAIILVVFTFLALKEENRVRENNQLIELIKVLKQEQLLK